MYVIDPKLLRLGRFLLLMSLSEPLISGTVQYYLGIERFSFCSSLIIYAIGLWISIDHRSFTGYEASWIPIFIPLTTEGGKALRQRAISGLRTETE
jgi:hypothetical protein